MPLNNGCPHGTQMAGLLIRACKQMQRWRGRAVGKRQHLLHPLPAPHARKETGWCQTVPVTAASGADQALGSASPRPSPASPRTQFWMVMGLDVLPERQTAARCSPTLSPAQQGPGVGDTQKTRPQRQLAMPELVAELHAVETGLIPATNLTAP